MVPGQTPTLSLCVARHNEIEAFIPRPYWVVAATAVVNGRSYLLEWAKPKGQTFREKEAREAKRWADQNQNRGKVTAVRKSTKSAQPPVGMNTVELLRVASSSLGLSPHRCMHVAEQLYLAGYVSYPRTESTRFPASFDLKAVCEEHADHPVWGKHASRLLAGQGGVVAPTAGNDAGDHPPITPTSCCTRSTFRSDQEWKVYER